MGITSSYPVPRNFESIKNWTWHRATSAISSYHDKGYDFGVNGVEVANILGCSENDALEIIKLLSHNPSKCNAVTLLAAIILISEHGKSLDKARFEHLFDLLDLSKKESLTKDEFTIMLLCSATAAAVILGKSMATSDDPICVGLSDKIYDFLEKDADHPISKDEFNLWAHEHIHHMTIDKVFPMFITTTDIPIQQKVVVEEPPAPFVYNSQVQEQEEEITIPIEIKIDESNKLDLVKEDVQDLANEMLDGDYEFDDFESRPNTAAVDGTQDVETMNLDTADMDVEVDVNNNVEKGKGEKEMTNNVEEGEGEKEMTNEEKNVAKEEELIESMDMLDTNDDIDKQDFKNNSDEKIIMNDIDFDTISGNNEEPVVVGDSLTDMEKELENENNTTTNTNITKDLEEGVETLPQDTSIISSTQNDVITSGVLEESYEADFDDAGKNEQDGVILGRDSAIDTEQIIDVVSESVEASGAETVLETIPPTTKEDLDVLLDELDVATAETPAKPTSAGDDADE